MTEPLIRRLHARGERLTVAALAWVAPVYRAMAQVEQVIELPFAHGGLQWGVRRALAAELRGRFDRAYVCPNSLKSALLPWWAGIPLRMGYHGEGRYLLLNRRLANPPRGQRPPMVAWYSALAGEPSVAEDRPALQADAASVKATLDPWQLQANGYYVLAPGAEYGAAKRWPARHFAVLAQQLTMPVVLLGSAKESGLCAEIAEAVHALRPGHCQNWAGHATLDQSIQAISAARAMVSNDSGLMHVAAAFGVPQVALFGSSSPRHTPPLSPQAKVLWLKDDPHYQPPLDCAPCFERECKLGHTRCLVDIQPDRVLQML